MDIPDSGKSKCKGPEAGKHRIFSRKLSVAWWRQWSTVRLKVGCYRTRRVWLACWEIWMWCLMGPPGVPGQVSDMIRSVFWEAHSGYVWRIDERARVDSGKWKWVTEALVPGTLPGKTPVSVDLEAGHSSRYSESSSSFRPENPLLSEAHLPHLCLFSTLSPLSETAWFWVGMENELQPPPHSKCGLSHRLVWTCWFRASYKAETYLAWFRVASPHSCAQNHLQEARVRPFLPRQLAVAQPPLTSPAPRLCCLLLFGVGWLPEVGLIGRLWAGDVEIRACSWSWQFFPLRPDGLNLQCIHSSDSPGSGGAPNTH